MSKQIIDRKQLASLYEIYKLELTPKQTEVFELYYYEDYTLAEVAVVLKTTRSNVHKIIQNVEQKLNTLEANIQVKKNYNYNAIMLKKNKVDESIIEKLR